MSHGRPRTAMELRKFTSFSCQLQVSVARVSHFLDNVAAAGIVPAVGDVPGCASLHHL